MRCSRINSEDNCVNNMNGGITVKIALVANRIEKSIERNMENIILSIEKAAENGGDLVLFPEACITGLINNDVPEDDIKLGFEVLGSELKQLCDAARKNNINVAAGFLEKEEYHLYDSAVFINKRGDIALKYRRMSKGWHGKNADADFYREGTEVGYYNSDIGRICFLICGDLFDDSIVEKAKSVKPDYLLFPFARSFYMVNNNQEEWDKYEGFEYAKRVKKIGATTLMANYIGTEEIGDTSFGGAFVITSEGKIVKEMPLDKEGILYAVL